MEKGVESMLSLSLVPGEYLTIGDNVVIQFDQMSGSRCKLAVFAPKEIPIVRGEVLERNGKKRPDCVFDAAHGKKSSSKRFQTADEPVGIYSKQR